MYFIFYQNVVRDFGTRIVKSPAVEARLYSYQCLRGEEAQDIPTFSQVPHKGNLPHRDLEHPRENDYNTSQPRRC